MAPDSGSDVINSAQQNLQNLLTQSQSLTEKLNELQAQGVSWREQAYQNVLQEYNRVSTAIPIAYQVSKDTQNIVLGITGSVAQGGLTQSEKNAIQQQTPEQIAQQYQQQQGRVVSVGQESNTPGAYAQALANQGISVTPVGNLLPAGAQSQYAVESNRVKTLPENLAGPTPYNLLANALNQARDQRAYNQIVDTGTMQRAGLYGLGSENLGAARTIGDTQTQQYQKALGIAGTALAFTSKDLNVAGFYAPALFSEQSRTAIALEYQRERSGGTGNMLTATPSKTGTLTEGNRVTQYYSGELQKVLERPVEQASEYHYVGKVLGIPTPANPYELQSDIAVEILKGTPTKSSEVFSPVSGLASMYLPGGMGVQQQAWETARTGAAPKVSFLSAINLFAAAEGQHGPYGSLYGGPSYAGTPSSEGIRKQDAFVLTPEIVEQSYAAIRAGGGVGGYSAPTVPFNTDVAFGPTSKGGSEYTVVSPAAGARLVGGKTVAGVTTTISEPLPAPFISSPTGGENLATQVFINLPKIATGAVASGIDFVTGFATLGEFTPMKSAMSKTSPDVKEYIASRDETQSTLQKLQAEGIAKFGTDITGRIQLDTTNPDAMDFKNRYETAINKYSALESTAKAKGVLVYNYGVGDYVINPEKTVEYGEFTKFGRGAGDVIRQSLGFNKEQLQAYGVGIERKQGILGSDIALNVVTAGLYGVTPEYQRKSEVTREQIIYGTGSIFSTEPQQFVTGYLGGAGVVLGGEAIAGISEGIGLTSRIAGVASRYPTAASAISGAWNVAVPAAMAGLTYYSASEGLTASPGRTTTNIGRMLPELAGAYYGGVSVSPGALIALERSGIPGIYQSPVYGDVVTRVSPEFISRQIRVVDIPAREGEGTLFTTLPAKELPLPEKPSTRNLIVERVTSGYQPSLVTVDLAGAKLIEPALAKQPPKVRSPGFEVAPIKLDEFAKLYEFPLAKEPPTERVPPGMIAAKPVVSEGFIPIEIGGSIRVSTGMPSSPISKAPSISSSTGSVSILRNQPLVPEVSVLDLTGVKTPMEQKVRSQYLSRLEIAREGRMTPREMRTMIAERNRSKQEWWQKNLQPNLPGTYEPGTFEYERVVKPSVFIRDTSMQVSMLRDVLRSRTSEIPVNFERAISLKSSVGTSMISQDFAIGSIVGEFELNILGSSDKAKARTQQMTNLVSLYKMEEPSSRSERDTTASVSVARAANVENIQQNIMATITGTRQTQKPKTRETTDFADNIIGIYNPTIPEIPPGTPRPIVPIIPPVVFPHGIPGFGGPGAGGGGRLSGFLFTERLNVRTAREVLFGGKTSIKKKR